MKALFTKWLPAGACSGAASEQSSSTSEFQMRVTDFFGLFVVWGGITLLVITIRMIQFTCRRYADPKNGISGALDAAQTFQSSP